jgi:hypothetical protein
MSSRELRLVAHVGRGTRQLPGLAPRSTGCDEPSGAASHWTAYDGCWSTRNESPRSSHPMYPAVSSKMLANRPFCTSGKGSCPAPLEPSRKAGSASINRL